MNQKSRLASQNALYFDDNLDILREHVRDESVDLVYLNPPFNSNASYNILFRSLKGDGSHTFKKRLVSLCVGALALMPLSSSVFAAEDFSRHEEKTYEGKSCLHNAKGEERCSTARFVVTRFPDSARLDSFLAKEVLQAFLVPKRWNGDYQALVDRLAVLLDGKAGDKELYGGQFEGKLLFGGRFGHLLQFSLDLWWYYDGHAHGTGGSLNVVLDADALLAASREERVYVIDQHGAVFISDTGLCWRAGYWTPAAAAVDPAGCQCDKNLLPADACAPFGAAKALYVIVPLEEILVAPEKRDALAARQKEAYREWLNGADEGFGLNTPEAREKFIDEWFSSSINWKLVKGGLAFTYWDYEVTPYAMGRPEIVVPKAALEGIVKPEILNLMD